jgi:hypothetical protein
MSNIDDEMEIIGNDGIECDLQHASVQKRVFWNDDLMRTVISYIYDCVLPFVLTCRDFWRIFKSLGTNVIESTIESYTESVSQMNWLLSSNSFNSDKWIKLPILCDLAARKKTGSPDVLIFLRTNYPHLPWNKSTCASAAEKGNMEILQWLRSQEPPCPWDAQTCNNAASQGHLDILKWSVTITT